MGNALYAFTTDKDFFENSFNMLDKKDTIDRTIIKRELTLLVIFAIDYLLRSKKLQKNYGEKGNQLMGSYLGHFKDDTDKTGTGDLFIDLLEARGSLYNQFIERDSLSSATHYSFKIAEMIANYCGVDNDPLFIMKVMNIWECQFKTLSNMFKEFKLIN